MVGKRKYNKEIILEILKKNKDGLTFAELNNESGIGHSLYEYLKRLNDDGLVETFIPKTRVGKVVGFRATEKAWEEERKERAIENLRALYDIMAKKMSADILLDTNEEKVLEEIEKVIK